MDYCPRCGSQDIRLFADKSGWCMRCNMPFMMAASHPTPPPVPGAAAGGQDPQPVAAPCASVTVAGQHESLVGKSPSLGSGPMRYGVPVEAPTSGPWVSTGSSYASPSASAENSRATTAGVFICVGSAVCAAAVVLSVFFVLPLILQSGAGFIICFVAIIELILAAVAFESGLHMSDYYRRSSTVALVTGAILAVMSLFLIGGIIGIIGGVVIFIGGLAVQA